MKILKKNICLLLFVKHDGFFFISLSCIVYFNAISIENSAFHLIHLAGFFFIMSLIKNLINAAWIRWNWYQCATTHGHHAQTNLTSTRGLFNLQMKINNWFNVGEQHKLLEIQTFKPSCCCFPQTTLGICYCVGPTLFLVPCWVSEGLQCS